MIKTKHINNPETNELINTLDMNSFGSILNNASDIYHCLHKRYYNKESIPLDYFFRICKDDIDTVNINELEISSLVDLLPFYFVNSACVYRTFDNKIIMYKSEDNYLTFFIINEKTAKDQFKLMDKIKARIFNKFKKRFFDIIK